MLQQSISFARWLTTLISCSWDSPSAPGTRRSWARGAHCFWPEWRRRRAAAPPPRPPPQLRCSAASRRAVRAYRQASAARYRSLDGGAFLQKGSEKAQELSIYPFFISMRKILRHAACVIMMLSGRPNSVRYGIRP